MIRQVRTIIIPEWDDEILEEDLDDGGYEEVDDDNSNLMYAFQENVHFGF